MSRASQASLLLGVLLTGAAVGAGALYVASNHAHQQTVASNTQAKESRNPAEAEQLTLGQLRHALARLGVPTKPDTESATFPGGTPSQEVESGDALSGESAADVLARLEREYKDGLAREEEARLLATNAAAATPAPTAPAPVAEPVPPVAAARPAASLPTPAAPADTRVAQNSNVQIVQGDVVAGDVNTTTVNNQIAMVTQFQQLFLVNQAGATGARPTAPTSQPRTPGPSSQDSNPWASVDYGSHYANPWGSTFGRRP